MAKFVIRKPPPAVRHDFQSNGKDGLCRVCGKEWVDLEHKGHPAQPSEQEENERTRTQ